MKPHERTLAYTKRWINRDGLWRPWLDAEGGRSEALAEAFDAAVQSVGKGAEVIEDADGGLRLMVAGQLVGHVYAGRFTPSKDARRIGFAPGAIADFVNAMYSHWLCVLREYARERDLGEVFVALPLVRSRMGYFTRNVQSALKTFFGALAPGVVRAFHRLQSTNPHLLAWLSDGNSLRRQQAFAALPVPLMRLFGGTSENEARVHMDEVGAVVDAGVPLVPVLAKRLAAPKAAVHRLAGVTVQRVGGSRRAMDFPVQVLSCAPGTLRLHRRNDYKAFGDLVSLLEWLGLTQADGLRRVLAESAATPAQLIETERTLRRELDGLKDVLDDGRRYLRAVLPIHEGEGLGALYLDDESPWPDPVDAALKAAIVGGRNLRGLERLNRDWHAFVVAATARLREVEREAPVLRWPPAFPQGIPPLASGHTFIELVSEDDLFEEGAALNHCVAGYAYGATAGARRLLSLRDADGVRRSTAELVLDAAGELRCAQQRGLTNAPAAPEDVAALNEVLRRVRAGEIPFVRHWPPLRAVRQTARLDTRPFWAERIGDARLASLRATLMRDRVPEAAG